MKIAVIQGSTQSAKNSLLYDKVAKATEKQGHTVYNFGVFPDEKEIYSYPEIALLISLLLSSKAVDFVVSGCSSGQGMNMACNMLPGVLSGFLATPQDAFLFGRINDGNVACLSLGLGFGWQGELNLTYILEKLFDGEFGIGYPSEVTARKMKEAAMVKTYNRLAKHSIVELLAKIDQELLHKIMRKENVISFIIANTNDIHIIDFLNGNKPACI